MLPPVLDEGAISPFKFWFNDKIQHGMYFRSELFYRLHTVGIEHRARLYHYACRLARHDAVIVTASDADCSVWVSLRSPSITALSLRSELFPPLIDVLQEGTDN
ncbi:hypothetical protein H6F88_28210 [Oculatella sp. FACHB-28]|uniref:hypothetical protein n=1 Tax=Cyanophyceae TaxID=3028117 RepID=UPI001682DAB0|nr:MULTISPECIES: hypothetical protein [Cyanophyceae]MBD1869793.1 hypothetical protein [Cyanobacteria bacterium FACHB-471]MBD1997327.1 hypothetical protein [Leptolyngbya sp. FACHB-541]MBD2059826.1 hypothetical protein [Oculatella sp. FACHB-28]MBD2070798.1 hypothetical protein [Leptolyngbya sp. FACHB-671]